MREIEEIKADLERWAENKILVKKFKQELREVIEEPKPKKDNFDLDGDGDVDSDDVSLAGKVLASVRKKKSKKSKKK